jgi:Rrf2 family protein
MKLSTKCRYGTRAMLEMARRHGEGAIKRKDISQAQDISHSYLENILIALKTHRLITTSRGAQGGFTLARLPAEISLLDIVQALEGSIAPVECIEKTETCAKAGHCVARRAWQKLHDAQTKALASMSLQDLLDMEKEGAAVNYEI